MHAIYTVTTGKLWLGLELGLDDLYPHLSPSDDDLEAKGYKAYMVSIDARIDSMKISQLAMAAPLKSPSQPSSSHLARRPQPPP